MYNSRRVSRTGRTIQRRKVDTGITIDPTKVKAYAEYLLNNGYVQLPRPAPSPDGTYIFMPNLSLNVQNLMSTQIFAEDFIESVLSSQNIFLNGNETVYMELQTTLSGANIDDYLLDIFNQASTTTPFITRISYGPVQSITLNIAFIYCSGRYSIVLRGSTYSGFNSIGVTKNSNQPASSTRSYIAFGPSTFKLSNSVVTIITIGQDSE